MPFLRHAFALLLFSSIVPFSQGAGNEWPIARGPSREPEPVAVDALLQREVPQEFTKRYPACYLSAKTWYSIESDGTVEATTHEIIRLNNRKGIDQFGEHRNVTYRPEYEKLTLNEARVIKPDGRRVEVEPKHMHLRDTQTDYFVYDTTKELIISFPGLEPGDVIETKWTTRGKNPEYAGKFFMLYQLGDERSPILRESFGVRVPKDTTLRCATSNPHLMTNTKPDPEITEKDGSKLFVWHSKDRLPVIKEDLMPSKEELRPGVAISTFANWQEVANWERKARTQCCECTPDLKKIVASVKGTHKTDEEIARELTYWVRKHIRYVSTGDKHDFTPHSPELIYRNRFGDCKDGVQLLSVLLKEAGISSQQISLNALGDGQLLDDVPSPMTTHAILLTTIGGNDHWVDTTVSQAAWDFLPKSDRDRAAYAVDDKSFRLLRTPKMTPEENRTEVVTKKRLDPDGTSHNVRESSYFGEAAVEKRDEWVDVSDQERRKLIRADLLDSSSKAKLADRIGIDENVLRICHLPVKAVVEFDIQKQLQGGVDLEGSIADNTLWSRFLSIGVDLERTQPIEMKEQFESRQTYIVEAPPGYRLSGLPEDRAYTSKWGEFTRTTNVSESGRVWSVVFHTKIDRTRIEPVDFAAFLTFQEQVSSGHRAYLTMKPADNAKDLQSDIDLLGKKAEKEPKNAALAIELIKLCLRADDKDKANVVLGKARKLHPNNRSLLELTSKIADDFKVREEAYRELIKRFPDEAKYQLELARELIDAEEINKARDLLQRLAKGEASDGKAEALLLLAHMSMDSGDAAKALTQLNDAKLADADAVDTAEAHQLEGAINEKLGKDKQALAAFQKALTLDAKDGQSLEGLVRLSFKSGKKDDALKYLREYVEADGPDGIAANWFFKLGRLDDAEEMLRVNPPADNTDVGYRVLGLIKFRRGQWEEAAAILKRAKPVQADQLHASIVSSLMLGRLSEAIEWVRMKNDVEATTEIKRDAAEIERLKARRDEIRKNHTELKAVSHEGLDAFVCAEYLHSLRKLQSDVEPLLAKAISDELGEAFALRGELLVEKGQLTKAVPNAEKAIKTAPKDGRGYYVLGRVYYERERKEATGLLKKAVELSGEKDANMLHWLATALIRDKEPNAARSAQLKAAMLRPDDREINEQLQQIEDLLSRGQ